jgi:hypothetical protein
MLVRGIYHAILRGREQTIIRFVVKHTIRERVANPFCGYIAENLPVLWYELSVIEHGLEGRTAEGKLVELWRG